MSAQRTVRPWTMRTGGALVITGGLAGAAASGADLDLQMLAIALLTVEGLGLLLRAGVSSHAQRG
jgi:hypothetical protein